MWHKEPIGQVQSILPQGACNSRGLPQCVFSFAEDAPWTAHSRLALIYLRTLGSRKVSGFALQPGSEEAAKVASACRISDWTLNRIDPDGLRHVATVAVRVHWFVGAVVFLEVMYRPYYEAGAFAVYVLLFLLLVGFTGYTHYRLRSNRTITWRLILALSAIDALTVSVAVAIRDGFSHDFIHLFYYPALAGFAVIFTSFRLNMA